jgi:hypothetical protein
MCTISIPKSALHISNVKAMLIKLDASTGGRMIWALPLADLMETYISTISSSKKRLANVSPRKISTKKVFS